MADIEPITREELLLNSIAGEGDSGLSPITRQEMYLSAIAGESDLPADMTPITREEIYYQKILDNGGAGGGGGEATGTKTINITANGTTSHNVKAYATAQIITNVPNPSTGTKQISENGTHDVTDFASAQVNVPNSYCASDEGKVVSGGTLVAQTSRSVTANGTIDTTLNSEVNVNVSNSYSSSDEGKVVSNGALVAQTSQSITENGTYDTTTKNSVNVAVPQGITPSGSQTFTENGTYDVTNLAEAVVNVASSGGAEYYTGTIVFNDTDATSITFPVGVGSSDEFLFEFELIKTGTVTDGVVTYDNMLRWHDVQAVLGAWAKRRSDKQIITSGYKPLFGSYNYLTYSRCGTDGSTGVVNENYTSVLTLDSNSITFTPRDTTKKFGAAGVYFEYKYHIFVARNAL